MIEKPGAPPGATPRRVGLVWTLLTINVLGFLPSDGMILPLPKVVGQLVTMGSLVLAFLIALTLNPRGRVRPNVYLLLLSLMALVAIASSLFLESGLGSLLRCFRLTVFVATLWMICRWWNGDIAFARFHLRTLCLVLISVVLGFVSPGSAFSGPDGRLVGDIWPIPAPQVGQYCAIAIGLSVLMWLGGRLDGRTVAVIVPVAFVLLLLTHTRTALLAMVVGTTVAGVTQILSNGRIRRFLSGALVVGVLGAVTVGGFVVTWLQRGQDQSELLSLTGRQKVWTALIEKPRTPVEQLIGVGLTDKSYGGLPIDSSWLSTYQELGLVGVGIVVAMLLVLLITAFLRPPSAERSCAVFLVVYCLISSYTEVGLGDASPYLLHLAVATSLLLRPVTTGAPTASPFMINARRKVVLP